MLRTLVRSAVCLGASALVLGCSGSSPSNAGNVDAGAEAAVDPRAGTWHVRNGFVRDPQGRALIMRGVNLAGAHKSAPYFGFHTAKDFVQVADPWGFNGIRLLTVWAALEPTKGTYDAAYLEKLAQRVQWAKDAGLLVVIDVHQDLFGEGFPGGDGAPAWACDASHYAAFKPKTPWFMSYDDPNIQACYDAFWGSDDLQSHYVEATRKLAERLKGFDNVIGIDPMNEPYWGSAGPEFEDGKLIPLYAKVMTAVRGQAPNWLAFAEPSARHNLGLGTAITSFPFDQVVFSPHSYDSSAEGGTPFPASSHSILVGVIQGFADEAARYNAALWIGEYGGMSNAGLPVYMDAEYEGAGSIAASAMYWADDRSTGGYGLLNDDGSEKDITLTAVVRPYPARTAGDPVDYAFDDKTSTFTFHYKPDRSVKAPTEISVPTRRFPSGFHVDCGGCTVTTSKGWAHITAPAAGDTVKVTITP